MTGDAAPIAPKAPKASRPGSRKGRQVGAPVPAVQSAIEATSTPPPAPPATPELLARTLRAFALELERDPDLARRVAQAIQTGQTASDADYPAPALPSGGAPAQPGEGAKGELSAGERASKSRTFVPQLVTGAGPELGTGIPDPFALRARLGDDGLRAALAALRLGTLRAIAREHRIDPSGRLAGPHDAEKLRAMILEAAQKGSHAPD